MNVGVITKIQKLLARAADAASSPAEAAVAMRKAQELAEKHRIDMARIGAIDLDKVEPVSHGHVSDTGNDTLPQWIWGLFWAVTRANRCDPFLVKGVTPEGKKRVYLHAIGRESDRQIAGYMFAYIRQQIERFCREDAVRLMIGNSPKWRNEYKVTAARVVDERIYEQQVAAKRAARAEAVGCSEMVLVSDEKRLAEDMKRVRDELFAIPPELAERLKGVKVKASRNTWKPTEVREDSSAVAAGRTAGQRVDITSRGGHGAMGPGSKQIC